MLHCIYCVLRTYLVDALLAHFISQPRAVTGKAVWSLWCGYFIVYSAIPIRDPAFVYTALLTAGTLLLFQSGVCHIHDHSTPCTLHFHCYLYLCILLR